jgi:hypothetical protein
MRKFGLILAITLVFATVVYASKKFAFTATPIVPAASGWVELGKDHNGNTEVKLKVKDLARPENLTPPESYYIVWLQGRDSAPHNEGELRVNGKLEGQFQTVTPKESFDVFVTGENDKTVKLPVGPEVLRTSVSR